MKKILKRLSENRGDAYIDLVMMIIGSMMAIVVGISCGGAIIDFFRVNAAVQEVRRTVEMDGKYDSAEQQKISTMLQNSGVQATVTCTASGEIPLDSTFTVTLKNTAYIGIGGIGSMPVTVSGSSTGRGEIYWKD